MAPISRRYSKWASTTADTSSRLYVRPSDATRATSDPTLASSSTTMSLDGSCGSSSAAGGLQALRPEVGHVPPQQVAHIGIAEL